MDIETGSSPRSKREAMYSIFILENSSSYAESNISLMRLLTLVEEINPKFIVFDNISEIAKRQESFTKIVCKLPIFTRVVELTRVSRDQHVALNRIIKYENMNYTKKLDPSMTAEYLAELTYRGYGSYYEDERWIPLEKYKNHELVESLLGIHVPTMAETMIKQLSSKNIHSFVASHHRIETVLTIIGEGKESNVYLVKGNNKQEFVVKFFKPYSPVAKKKHKTVYRMSHLHIAIKMAKLEARNLSFLETNGFSVPKYLFFDGPLVGMKLVTDNGYIAKRLSEVEKKYITEKFLFQGLDLLYKMFGIGMVHGDFSAQNLLVCNDELVIIDVMQANLVNLTTFTDTPIRIRIDRALKILRDDINNFLSFFERKNRISVDRDVINSKFLDLIPEQLKGKFDSNQVNWFLK